MDLNWNNIQIDNVFELKNILEQYDVSKFIGFMIKFSMTNNIHLRFRAPNYSN
jgi:hypothetical protein